MFMIRRLIVVTALVAVMPAVHAQDLLRLKILDVQRIAGDRDIRPHRVTSRFIAPRDPGP